MSPSTVTLSVAAQYLGIGRSTAYKTASNGTFPVRVIKSGSRYVVPIKPLLELLGEDELPDLKAA